MSRAVRDASRESNARWCCYPDCEARADDRLLGQPMCIPHGLALYRVVREVVRDETAMQRRATRAPAVKPAPKPPATTEQVAEALANRAMGRRALGTIYYARIGSYIKIGFTTQPVKRRLSAIQADQLLATEVGTMNSEKARHMQFGSSWSHREYFNESPELMRHIESLQRKAKAA